MNINPSNDKNGIMTNLNLSMLKKDSAAQNLRPIEVESPQPEERGRGLVTDSGTGVEGCYSGWRSK